MQGNATLPSQRKGRRMLLGLIIFFALPILLVLALHQTGWRPGGTSHGELLTPPQPLQLPALQDLQGRPFLMAQWHSKWSLVYAAGSDGCSAACQQQVHTLRQIHASLNKDIERAQRVLLLPKGADMRNLPQLQQRYPDLIVLVAQGEMQLAGHAAQPGQVNDVFLVDPMGNLIMRYAPGYAPKGLREDLQRLLKYSWVG
jgi:cytochrome oxidase Cu insertion factor (SCO1/SenC/PrrC family)